MYVRFIGFVSVLVAAGMAGFAAAHPSLTAAVDSIFTARIAKNAPGAAVLIRRNGRAILARSYGIRDLRTRVPIDGNTNFRLASVTKQFTAMAIMLLVHDRKLQYDSTLANILPGFPAYGNAITIRDLLTHTSGLPDYEELMEAPSAGKRWTPEHQIEDHEVLQLLMRQPAGNFAPGTQWSYSNSGYVVLGLIVAKVSGMPFEQFVEQRIFRPLQMSGSVVRHGGREPRNRAFGHTCNDAGCVEQDQSSTSATLGDGGIYSNLDDLAKWDAALESHVLLPETEMKAALTPSTLSGGRVPSWPAKPGDDNLAPGKPVSYGFGWFVDPWNGHRRMWHFGSTAGFRTAIERFPAERLTIVVLANRADLDSGALALEVADLAFANRAPAVN